MLDLSAVDTPDALFIVDNNCGTGAGGFQPGNTCAKGGGGDSLPVGVTQEMYDNWKKIQDSGKTVKDPYYDKILASTKKWVALGEPIGSAFGIQAMVYTDHMMKAQAAETEDQPGPEPESFAEFKEAYAASLAADAAYEANPSNEAYQATSEATAKLIQAEHNLGKDFDDEDSYFTKKLELKEQVKTGQYEAKADQPAAKPPEAKPEAPPLTVLKTLKTLGGSTGAKLVMASDGNRYVAKKGANEGHLKEEHIANELYKAMGVQVPKGEMITGDDGKPVRLAEFVEGKTLAELKGSERAAAEAKLRENFAADALLGNWDVVGMGADNVMVDDEGTVYRIDNGGSLRYRAQGAMKSLSQFDNTVGELTTMREKGMAGKVFGSLTDTQVAAQVMDLAGKREAVLAAAPDDLKGIIGARLTYMETWAKGHLEVGPLDAGAIQAKIAELKQPGGGPLAESLAYSMQVVHDLKVGQPEMKWAGAAEATPSSSPKNPHAGDSLKQLITSTKGGTFYTDLQIAKIVALNPEGVKDGKFFVSGAKPEVLAAHIEHLKSVLPPGTQIVKANINAAKAKELLTKGDAQASEYIKPVKMALAKATSKIDGPGVVDAALGTMKAYDTGYASDSLYWKGTPGGGVVEHPTGTFEFKTEVPKGFEYYSEKDTAWQGSLKPTEKNAINSWTGGGYVEMRKRIAAGKSEAKDKHFLAAIGKSPDFQGTLYRGIKSGGSNGYGVKLMQAIAEIGVGGIWGEKCPASSSVSPRTAKGFSGDHILLKIQAKTAKSIFSAGVNSQEKEVVLQPNKKYRITGITKNAHVKTNNSGLGTGTVKMLVELEEI